MTICTVLARCRHGHERVRLQPRLLDAGLQVSQFSVGPKASQLGNRSGLRSARSGPSGAHTTTASHGSATSAGAAGVVPGQPVRALLLLWGLRLPPKLGIACSR